MSAEDRLSTSYQPDFDIDAAVGRTGELFVASVIDSLKDSTAEVKTDMRAADTGRFFVEYQCFRRGAWRQSGIATTRSGLWIMVAGQVAVCAPTDSVKKVARVHYKRGASIDMLRGSHPTRGVLVNVGEYVSDLIRATTS